MTDENNKKKHAQKLASEIANNSRLNVSQYRAALEQLHPDRVSSPQKNVNVKEEERDWRIGIWQAMEDKKTGEVQFVRTLKDDDWEGAWCDCELIPPKQKKRVVLLGESVARGMHYDPYFTPAMVLEQYLQQLLGDDDYEVIDIARIDGTMGYLQKTLPLSLSLEPDLILIFAGNNWKNDPQVTAYCEWEEDPALTTLERFQSYQAKREQALNRMLSNYIALVQRCESLANVPIVHILPEFNLQDWQPKNIGVSPWDCPEKNQQWYSYYEQLKNDIALDHYDEVHRCANDFMAFDHHLSVTAPYLLGQYLLAKKEYAKARPWLEMAMDDEPVPRCIQHIQNYLRQAAREHQLTLIDLPLWMANAEPPLHPDRRFFLDYCHLTAYGIQQSMLFIAKQLLQHGLADKGLCGLTQAIQLDPYIEACGHFCGALYNGRFAQPYAILHYHLQRALVLQPSFRKEILAFLQHNMLPVSKGLNHNYLSQHQTPLYHIQKRLSIPKASLSIVAAIKAAIKPYDLSIVATIDRLLNQQWQIASLSLLDQHTWDRYTQAHQSDTLYLMFNRPHIDIAFIADASQTLQLDIILRLPIGSGDVSIGLNKNTLKTVKVTTKWQSVKCCIPVTVWQSNGSDDSPQTLCIRWPMTAVSRLPQSRMPVWGHIYHMHLRSKTDNENIIVDIQNELMGE